MKSCCSELGTYQLNRNAPPNPMHTNSTSTDKTFHSSAIRRVNENVKKKPNSCGDYSTPSPSLLFSFEVNMQFYSTQRCNSIHRLDTLRCVIYIPIRASIHTNVVPAKEHISTSEKYFSCPITDTNAKLSAETITNI